MRRLVPLVVAFALLAGCGGDDERGSATETVTEPTPTEPAGTTVAQATTGGAASTVVVRLYFLQDDKLAATGRSVDRTPAIGRATLAALAQGPTDAERELGFTSACTADELDGVTLTIANGEATVAPRLEGSCASQVAWTLLQFPSVRRVDGATRADLEQLAPAVLVDSPIPFQEVSSPLRVTGTANTFEATFEYDLLDAGGRKLAHHFVTATSGTGTRGTFDFSIAFDVDRAVDGELVVFESSAEDGSRINIRRIPLRLEPS